MDTPTTILKSAVYETNDNERIQKVIRACKIITDILPFDKKNEILLDEPEMMKYLILSMPILLSSISMILESIKQKFKKNPKFVKNLWDAIEFIATLEEKDLDNQMKLGNQNKMNSFEHNESELENLNKLEYCPEILRSKDMIKMLSLEFAQEISELVYRELHTKIDFIFDANGVLKRFIENTNNDKIIVKACSILERIKAYDLASNIDSEIEELLLSKKNAIMKNIAQEDAKDKMKSRLMSGLGSKLDVSINTQNKENEKQKGKDNEKEKNNRGKEKDHGTNKEIPKLKQIDTDNSSEEIEDPNNEFQNVSAKIEEWLVRGYYDEIPLIGKSDYMMEAIKLQENFENLILFIADQQAFIISPIWANIYPELMFYDYGSTSSRSHHHDYARSKKLKKLEDKSLAYYMFRSYKTMLALTDLRNFKYISSVNKNAVEYYFGVINVALKKEDTICNMNHVAKVAEYFLKREPEISINCILHCNMLYKLLQNIEFTYVQQLILSIFDCSENLYGIGEENFKKVFKYCKNSEFFDDLSATMLYGEKNIDPRKFETDYKPLVLENLHNRDENDDHSSYNIIQTDRNETKNSSFQTLLFEELNGFKSDIDGIKQYIRQKQPQSITDLKAQLSNVSTTNINDINYSSPQIDKMKKYPSLAEKIEKSNFLKPEDPKKNSKATSELNKITNSKKMNTNSSISSFTKVDTIQSLSDRSLSKQLEVSFDKISDVSKNDNFDDKKPILNLNTQIPQINIKPGSNLEINKEVSEKPQAIPKNKPDENLGVKNLNDAANPTRKNSPEKTQKRATSKPLEIKTTTTTATVNSPPKSKDQSRKGIMSEMSSPTNDNAKKLASPVNENTKKQGSPVKDNTKKLGSPANDNAKKLASPTNDNVKRLVSPSNENVKRLTTPTNDNIKKLGSPINDNAKKPQEASLVNNNSTKTLKPPNITNHPAGQINTSFTNDQTQNSKTIPPSPNKPTETKKKTMLMDTLRDSKKHLSGISPDTDDRRSSIRKGPIVAQSLLNGFFDDGSLTNKGMEQLNALYPVSTKSLIETDIDKESKKIEFTPSYLKENDNYAFCCCEVLDVMIRKSLQNVNQSNFKKLLGLPQVDYTEFWMAVLETQSKKFFENIMKVLHFTKHPFINLCIIINPIQNYLFKIKVHNQMVVNSGYSSGSLVNLLLENISTNQYLKNYYRDIHKTSTELLPFLCKAIINSHAWMDRKDIKIYLQTYTVQDPLGVGRLMLITTLKLIIWNDTINDYNIIYEINDTCWHTLIIWFHEKKSNNLYNHIFYLILEKIFEVGNEKLLITILFKLNLLANLAKIMNEICVNGVLFKEKHIDSVVYHIACIMKLIKSAIKEKQKYPKLIEQLKASLSWNALKEEEILEKIVVKIPNKMFESKKPTVTKEPTQRKKTEIHNANNNKRMSIIKKK